MRGAAGYLLILMAAMPASAQIATNYRPRIARPVRVDPSYGPVRESIHDGRENGQLTKRQAKALRRETNRAETIQSRTPNYLSDAERSQFELQRQALRDQVAAQRIQKRP